MAVLIPLSVKETNLLRERLQQLLGLRSELLHNRGVETVHDLRVASRRLREVLDYLQPSLPENTFRKSRKLAKRITRTLGSLRETEVNISLVEAILLNGEITPLAGEVLLKSLHSDHTTLEKKVMKEIASGKFSTYEALVDRIAASRNMPPTPALLLHRRKTEFLGFSLPAQARDEQLHELRIHTKKFRYAVEIYDRLHARNLGRFVNRVKLLQELLGEIHDWFVLENRLQREIEGWRNPRFTQIPAVLDQARETIRAHKTSLYSRVPALYFRVTQSVPPEILFLPHPDPELTLPFHTAEAVSE